MADIFDTLPAIPADKVYLMVQTETDTVIFDVPRAAAVARVVALYLDTREQGVAIGVAIRDPRAPKDDAKWRQKIQAAIAAAMLTAPAARGVQ